MELSEIDKKLPPLLRRPAYERGLYWQVSRGACALGLISGVVALIAMSYVKVLKPYAIEHPLIILTFTACIVGFLSFNYTIKKFNSDLRSLRLHLDKASPEALVIIRDWPKKGETPLPMFLYYPPISIDLENAKVMLRDNLIYFHKMEKEADFYVMQKWVVALNVYDKEILEEYINGRTAKL